MKTVAVICFDRPTLTEKCLHSLFAAAEVEEFRKILIFQKGNKEVQRIVDSFRDSFDLVTEVNRSGNSTQNINANRYLAYSIAFDNLHSDYLIVLEDDVQISYDALFFADRVFRDFCKDKMFRAFNFGSGVERNQSLASSYSKVRYALQGPASLLPKKSWEYFDKKLLEKKSKYEIFDGTFETYIQSGFVIMPNNSRYVDNGYSGTHTASYDSTDYFKKLERSWIGLEKTALNKPYKKNINLNWRKDCKTYNGFHNPYFYLRNYVVLNRDRFVFGFGLKIYRLIRKYSTKF
jgi:hypothetical protein